MRNIYVMTTALCMAGFAAQAETLRVCPTCETHSLEAALAKIGTDGTIILAPGTYREAGILRASGVTLRAEPGARLRGVAAEGKAALVIKGNDTTVEGLECLDIHVDDGNGACIRQEGRNLTLRHVYFHDSEEGLLAADDTGAIVIEDSRFERLGADGAAHGIYVGLADRLSIRRSAILSSISEGHEVKSRAAKTEILDSVIASLNGVDSRLVDVCDGGAVVIRNTVLEKGVNSANGEVIGYGLEGMSHVENSLVLDHNIIIIDRHAGRVLNGKIQPQLINNIVVGGDRMSGVDWYRSRAAAKLVPFPGLPRHNVVDVAKTTSE
jgi:hypothetical protein